MNRDEVFAIVEEARKKCVQPDLRGADLRQANLINADLGWADLREADLVWAELAGTDLREANLASANLRNANLRDTNLGWANLVEANLFRADLTGADLRGANLIRANLSKAKLRGANLERVDLIKANLGETSLKSADLAGADLREANLMMADLVSANLRGADMISADLAGADLREANLMMADLRKVNMRDANLSGVTGLLSQREWLRENFVWEEGLLVAYKAQVHIRVRRWGQVHTAWDWPGGYERPWPASWRWEPGAILEEVVNPCRVDDCGCGVNVATLKWCRESAPMDAPIWEVRVDPCGAVVPYNTDGKFRAEWIKLIRVVEGGEAQ